MSSFKVTESQALTFKILNIVIFTFVVFLCIGLPLAVLPLFVHDDLGFGAVLAGLVISLPYATTLMTRSLASSLSDRKGPKYSVLLGLLGCALSGGLSWIATLLAPWPWVSLVILVLSRAILGAAQALIGTGAISWGIGLFGGEHAAKVISTNGICSYGGIALGAPLGILLVEYFGLWSMGCTTLVAGLLAWVVACSKEAAPIIEGERMPFRTVLWKIFPNGVGLALGSIGFGSLSTFIALYYAEQNWDNAALCLTMFGLAFISARLLFADSIKIRGGYQVALLCFGVEILGLLLLWIAPNPLTALLGSGLTGFGSSLIYPALAVEILKKTPDTNRSAALGAYALFFDLALGLVGPVMGLIAGIFGYASIFLVSALLAVVGLLLVCVQYWKKTG